MLREFEGAGGWYTVLGADQGNSDFNPRISVSAYSQGYDSYHVTRTGIKTYTNGTQQIDPGGIYSYFNTMEFHPNLYHTLLRIMQVVILPACPGNKRYLEKLPHQER